MKNNRKKTVVFITSATDDPFIKKFKNQIEYQEYEDKLIGLQYLKRTTKILKQHITIQNQALLLADFIENNHTDFEVVDAKIIESFIKNKPIEIGSESLSISNLDGAYLDLAEDFSVDTLMNILPCDESDDIYLISNAVGTYHTEKMFMSLKSQMVDVISETNINFINTFAEILNRKDITKPDHKKIQLCDFIINKENFKQMCLGNPNRKIYWITVKYDDTVPKLA